MEVNKAYLRTANTEAYSAITVTCNHVEKDFNNTGIAYRTTRNTDLSRAGYVSCSYLPLTHGLTMYDKLKDNLDKQAKLFTELEQSTEIRKMYELPDTGVVSHQLVTNGYGDFKELRIKHEGKLVRVVKSITDVPRWLTNPTKKQI